MELTFTKSSLIVKLNEDILPKNSFIWVDIPVSSMPIEDLTKELQESSVTILGITVGKVVSVKPWKRVGLELRLQILILIS